MAIAENANFVTQNKRTDGNILNNLLANIASARSARGWTVSGKTLSLVGQKSEATNMSNIISEITYGSQAVKYASTSFLANPSSGSAILKDYIDKLQVAHADIVNLVGCSSGCTAACIAACDGSCKSNCTGGCGAGCTLSCGKACGENSCGQSCSQTCGATCSGGCTGGCSGCTSCTSCSGGCDGGCSGCGAGCASSCSNCGSGCGSSCSGCTQDCTGGCLMDCTSCSGGCSS